MENFKLVPGAIRQILTGSAAAAACMSAARGIASAGGPGMKVMPPERGANRVRVAVVTATYEAQRAEATGRSLTRAIGAGRSR
jgi:hypothetical protein